MCKINIFLDFWFKKNLLQCKIPRLFDILPSMRFIRFFHGKCSSNKTPKNLIWSTRFIRALFIFNVGKTTGMLSLFITLWNNVNLVLSAFRDNFLLLNQWLVFYNSLFTVLKSEWISFPK